MSTCVLNKGGSQRAQDTTTHSGDHREGVTKPQEKAQSQQTHKDLGGETILDRKYLLLLHLRDILGNETKLLLKVYQTSADLNCACLDCLLESNDTTGRTSLQKARKFYRSCLDTEAIEKAREVPFLQLIQTVRGSKGWTNEWIDHLDQADFFQNNNVNMAVIALAHLQYLSLDDALLSEES